MGSRVYVWKVGGCKLVLVKQNQAGSTNSFAFKCNPAWGPVSMSGKWVIANRFWFLKPNWVDKLAFVQMQSHIGSRVYVWKVGDCKLVSVKKTKLG